MSEEQAQPFDRPVTCAKCGADITDEARFHTYDGIGKPSRAQCYDCFYKGNHYAEFRESAK